MPTTDEPPKPEKPTVLSYSREKPGTPENRWDKGWRFWVGMFFGELVGHIVPIAAFLGAIWFLSTSSGC